jgi:hypothetical protein
MKRLKLLRSLLVGCAAAIALAGCGSGSDGGGSSDTKVAVDGSWADVRVASGNQSVTLSWEDKTETKADTVTYNIYFSTSPGVKKTSQSAKKIANVTSPYIHTGLTNGTAYYYVVTKVTNGREGVESYEGSAVPQPSLPAAPTGVKISSADTSVIITLTRTNEPSNIKYNLYWNQTGDFSDLSDSSKVNRLPDAFPGTNTSCTMNGMVNGTRYYFRITGDTGNGEGTASKTMSAVPRKQVSSSAYVNKETPAVMGAPYNVTAQNGNQQTNLTWSAVTPPTAYGTAADSTPINATETNKTLVYNVYWSNTPITALSGANKITVTGTSFTHPGLTNGSVYYYVVTAMVTGRDVNGKDIAATSFESAFDACGQVSVTPEAKFPGVPSGLAAATGNQQVALSWNRDKTGNTVSYNLYWTTDASVISDSFVVPSKWTKISSLTSNSYVHSGLTSGKTYYYMVTAVIDGESDYSARVSATP